MLVELLIFLTLAGTTALAFRPLMTLINRQFTVIRERLIRAGESYLNRPIRYGSMSPSLIGSIEIRDLVIGEPALAAAERLYIEYSLWDLLRGKGLGAIQNLVLEGPVFSFDDERDGDLKNLGGKGKKTVLPQRCLFSVRNGNLSFTKDKLSVSVSGVALDGEIRDRKISLEGLWRKNPLAEGGVTLEGGVNGSFSQELDRGDVTIRIDSVEGGGFSVDRLSFYLSFFEDRIAFKREADGLPLELSAEYIRDTGGFSGSFSMENFLPASMVHFSDSLENFAPFLALQLSGNASVSFGKLPDASGNGLSYFFDFSAEDTHSSSPDSPIQGFTFTGEGNQERVRFSQFSVNAKHGSAQFAGDIQLNPLLPQGYLSFFGFSLTGDGNVEGTLSFSRAGKGVAVASPSLSLGGVPISTLEGELVLDGGGSGYVLGFNRYRGPEPTSFESRGTLGKGAGRLEGTVTLRDFYASDFIAMARPFVAADFSPGGFVEKTSISGEIAFSTDFKSVQYRSHDFAAAYGTEMALSASIEGSDRQVELDGRIGQVDFGFNADFSDFRDITFECRIDYLDYTYDFSGGIRDQSVFNLRGGHDFSITAVHEEGRLSASVSGRSVPIPFRGRRAYVSLDAALSYHNSEAWNLSVERLDIREAQGVTELLVSGQGNQNGLNLDSIYYADHAGPLSGSAVAVWSSDFSIIDGSVILQDQTETEKITGDLFYESGELDFHGKLTGFKGERIVQGRRFLLSGEVFGGLSSEGYYLVNLSLDSLTGRMGEKDYFLSGMALVDPERIILSRIDCVVGSIQATVPFVSLDRNAGSLETEIQIAGMANDQPVGMLLSLRFNFRPMTTWMDLGNQDSLSAILDVKSAYIKDRESPPFSVVVTRTPLFDDGRKSGPSVYRVSGGPQDMINGEFRENRPGSGIFFLSLSNPSPVQGNITGVLDGTTFDALASDVFVDLGELWNLIPVSNMVKFTGGIITGETRVFGSVFDPEFAGTAWGTGITLTVPDFVNTEIGPGSGIITFADNGFSFGPVDAPCGEGHGIIHGGITLNRWSFGFYLDIDVDRKIPVDFNISGIMVKGNASGKLSLLLDENDEFNITGNVIAENAEITVNKEEIERSFSESRASGGGEIIADMRITAGPRVEFLWPNSNTPLLRAYGEAGTGVRIMADTRIPRFSLDGDVVLRGGELYYLQRSFYIRKGNLYFNGNDPQPNPQISVTAEIRDRNDEGPITISMILDRTPLSELDRTMPRFESIPSLSQIEIFSILGQAPSADSLEADSPKNPLEPVIKSASETIIQSVVFRRLERGIRNALGLDMFSFRTQILQNAVFEAVRNRDPDEQPSTMGNYLDNTAVFIGKYIGQALFFQTILSFRYDQYQREFGGMRFEPEVGFDLRTPLFDVRWNVRIQRLENYQAYELIKHYVGDQSISLIWRWSL